MLETRLRVWPWINGELRLHFVKTLISYLLTYCIEEVVIPGCMTHSLNCLIKIRRFIEEMVVERHIRRLRLIETPPPYCR